MSSLSPTNAREACSRKAGPDATIVAGCTDRRQFAIISGVSGLVEYRLNSVAETDPRAVLGNFEEG